MKIDCDTCVVRGDACGDCVVSFLTISSRPGARAPWPSAATASGGFEIDEAQAKAIDALAAGGLVAPLRHLAS